MSSPLRPGGTPSEAGATPGRERKDVGRMQEILARLVDVVATNPGAAVGVVGALLFGAMAWGVISSSYRYR